MFILIVYCDVQWIVQWNLVVMMQEKTTQNICSVMNDSINKTSFIWIYNRPVNRTQVIDKTIRLFLHKIFGPKF